MIKLEILPYQFSIMKVCDVAGIKFNEAFVFFSRTDSECTLVCRTEHALCEALSRQDGYAAFRVCGTLDFSLTGILAGLTAALADIPVFALSTFDTDYLLLREERIEEARHALAGAGYAVQEYYSGTEISPF